MKYKYIILFFLLFIFLFNFSINASDVWLVIDQLSLNELRSVETENMDYLQQQAAFSLVNVRSANDYHPENTYLSLGAGNRAVGNQSSHTGIETEKGIINPEINTLQKLNKDNEYHPEIGLLGTLLKKNNQKIAILGNTDNKNQKRRTIVSMFMNRKGYIPAGNISDQVLESTEKPWGYQTNWNFIRNNFLEYKKKVDTLVIETGDLTRIESFKNELDKNSFQQYKRKYLQNIDDFVGFILSHLDLTKSQLGIIVPTPPSQAVNKGQKLSWTLVGGPDFDQGWLRSDRTRRQGIITAADIIPLILNLSANNINFSSRNYNLREIDYILEEVGWADLSELNQKITVISNFRPQFIKIFISLQLFLIFMSGIKIFFKDYYKSVIFSKLFTYILITVLLVPLNFLLISIFTFEQLNYYIILLIILSILQIWLFSKLNLNRVGQTVIICLVTVILLTFDILNNGRLMADSILGYSSIIGARFYGLGNEYMGIYVGGILVGVTGVIELIMNPIFKRMARKFLIIIFMLAVILIGGSGFGANFGGSLTMFFAGIMVFFYMYNFKLNLKTVLISLSLFLFVFLSVLILDLLELMGPATHIGSMMESLVTGEFEEVYQVIERKIAMNLKLLRWNIWTKVLLGFLFYLLVVFLHPVGIWKKLFKKYPDLTSGLYGGIGGGILAMFINDSGVVAAATVLFFPVFIILYLLYDLQ